MLEAAAVLQAAVVEVAGRVATLAVAAQTVAVRAVVVMVATEAGLLGSVRQAVRLAALQAASMAARPVV